MGIWPGRNIIRYFFSSLFNAESPRPVVSRVEACAWDVPAPGAAPGSTPDVSSAKSEI